MGTASREPAPPSPVWDFGLPRRRPELEPPPPLPDHVRYPHKTAARIIAWGIALALLVRGVVALIETLP
jgi:hypothetical protein